MSNTYQDPVRFHPGVETMEEKEGETLAHLKESFDHIVETTKEDYGRAVRGVHAKNHGELFGTMTVKPDLPPEYRQGLFASAKEHPVVMRFSTNPGDILDDSVSVPRGLAVKVLNVEGDRLPGSEKATTQDFVLINGPVFSAASAADFSKTLGLLAKTTDRMEGVKKVASAFLQVVNKGLEKTGLGGSPTIQTLGGAPDTHPLGQTFFSQTAYRYGDYIAKFQIAPAGGQAKRVEGDNLKIDGRPDAIREEMNATTRDGGASFELRVQLCRDLEAMPVEDPTVEWSEEKSPFVPVATIHVEAQPAYEEDRNRQLDDELRFSPWTGLAAHQPLGGVNRVRKQSYEESSKLRSKLNGCPIHEPRSLAEIDA